MTNLSCTSTSCALQGQPVPAAVAQALGSKCPACQGPLEAPGSGLSETADRVIETFPYPIALPLQLLAGKTDVEARAKSLVDVLTNALKFQAMVVQSEYLRSDLVDEDLTTIIRKDLGRPLVSAWVKFVEAAVPRMEAAGIAPFVSELGPAYARAETGRKKDDQIEVPGKGYHDEEGEFVETRAKLGLVRALINFRNKFAHGFNQPEAESRLELDFYLGVLDQLLEELAWMADYTLLKREDGKVWRMMGAEPEVADIEWPQQAVDTGLALLAPDGQRVLPLFPLFIVPRQYVAETKAGEDLLVYDQDTGKRIVYVSPRGHHREIQGTLRPWRKLVAAKEVVLPPLDAAALTPEETLRRAGTVTRDTEDNLLAARKLLKGVYVNRPDAEVHLRPFPNTSFPLALVTAQAGAGKTTLLHHVAAEWAKGGAAVVLARANAIEGTDLMAWLRDELRLAASVTPEALAAGGASEDHPLVLVLDGLNEHGEREALLASILEFAAAIQDARHLKVLVSWRSERDDWAAAAKDQAALFLPAPGESDQKEGVPALHLTQLGTDEVRALWKRLGASDAARYKPRFTYDQLSERRRTAARMLTSPLVLRTFLEVYAGQGMPDSPSRRSLQHDWLVRLGERTGDGNRLLLDLARRCMDTGVQSLDLDALYDDVNLASEMRRTDVAAPITKLLRREGVLALVPGDSVELVFSMDRYLEQAAGSALVADGRAGTPADVLAAKEALGEWPMAEEALRAAVEERMRTEGDQFLLDLIDEGGEAAASLAGEVLARRVLDSGDPEGIAALLMEDPTEGDYHAANAAAAELDEELAYDVRCAFLEAVVGRIPASSSATEAEIQVRLTLASALETVGREQEAFTAAEATSARADGALQPCQTLADAIQGVAWRFSAMGRHREALAIHQRTLELEHRIHGEESGEMAGTLSAVGGEHECLGDYDTALDFRTQALEMQRRIYGDEHPEVAVVLELIGQLRQKKGDYEEAARVRMQTLEMSRRIYGEQHPTVARNIAQIAWVQEEKGDYDAALEFRTQALEMNRRIYGDEHPEVASSLFNIGGLHETRGDYDAALDFRTQALEMERRIYGAEHPEVAGSLSVIGGVHEAKGDYNAALDFRTQALEMSCRIYGNEHPRVAISLSLIGGVHEAKGDYDTALDFSTQALEMERRIYGDEHPDVAGSLSFIGGVHEAKGDYDAALDFRTQALEMSCRIYGNEHPRVAISLSLIGGVHEAKGDYDTALDFRTQALEMERRIYGEEHPEVAGSLSLIGGVHEAKGDYDTALDFRTQALEMNRQIYGEDHPEVAAVLEVIGQLRQKQGDYEEAARVRTETLEMSRRIYGEQHPAVARNIAQLAWVQEEKGDYDAALDFRTQALEMSCRIYGNEHPRVAISLSLIGGVHEAKGDYDTALDFRTQALEMERRIYGDEHPEVAGSLSFIGGVHEAKGDYDAALDFRTQALEMSCRIYGNEHPRVAISLSLIGGVHEAKGDYDTALEFRTQALEMERRIYGEEHPEVAGSLSLIGGVHEAKGDYDTALDFRTQALEMNRQIYGEDHPEVAAVLEVIGQLRQKQGDYEEAARVRTETLEMSRRIYGDQHPAVARNIAQLAWVQEEKGDYDAALDFRTQALEMGRRIYGEEHPEVAGSLSLIGGVHEAKGDYDTALDFRTQALEMERRIYGEEHPEVAGSLSLIGGVHEAKGDYDTALDFRTQTLAMLRSIHRQEHPNVATALSLLGSVHLRKGDLDTALGLRIQALEMERRIYGEKHPEVAKSLSLLGGVYLAMGIYEQALELRAQSLEMVLCLFGDVHPEVAVGFLRTAETLLQMGRRESALEDLARCIAARGDAFGACTPDVRAARTQLAELLLEDGDREAARRAAEAALEELHPEADAEAIERARRVLGQD